MNYETPLQFTKYPIEINSRFTNLAADGKFNDVQKNAIIDVLKILLKEYNDEIHHLNNRNKAIDVEIFKNDIIIQMIMIL